MRDLRLLIFDVDGTLVDSADCIVRAVTAAFDELGRTPPDVPRVRSGIGLSVPDFFDHLGAGPEAGPVIARFRYHYRRIREIEGTAASSPLFAGARAALDRLAADPHVRLAVATGKSRRGLDALIADHGLEGRFTSLQTADTHPSKPHPSMIEAILRDTGMAAARTAMLGDTSFDMAMARAAGVAAIGVTWGYHPGATLDADRLIADFDGLEAAFDAVTAQRSAT